MSPLPPYVTIQPGERVVALIHPAFAVQALSEALLAIIGLMAAILFTIALDLSLDRPLAGPGPGLMMTLVFLIGPVLLQRVMSTRAPYVLTSGRLIIDAETEVALNAILRLRVWPTSLGVQTVAQRRSLSHLVNPSATARLIHDTIATQRSV